MKFPQASKGNTKIAEEILDKISCEVKESLNSIIGFSNLLNNSSLNPKQIEQINNVLISSEQLLEFANNISGISKLIGGKYETNYYTFSTEKLLNEMINSFESITQKKGIDFKSEISEVKITNDYQLTSQIIYSIFNYLIKTASKNSSIIVRNNLTSKGVLIELENNATKLINQQKAPDLSDILNSEENCSGNLDFYLTNHLISLIEGRIIFSNTENNSSIIQVYIPNKLA